MRTIALVLLEDGREVERIVLDHDQARGFVKILAAGTRRIVDEVEGLLSNLEVTNPKTADPVQDQEPAKCPKCGKVCAGLQGVEVHIGRAHP